MIRLALAALLVLVVVSSASAGPPRAFPEAEGYGALALTTCNRTNVQVLLVTTTEDRNPTTLATVNGSFRKAIENFNNKVNLGFSARDLSVVIFRVGGRNVILNTGETATRRLYATAPCLYIAGQTAPGGGFWISDGEKFMINSTSADCKDHVVRYLTFARFGSVNAGYACRGPAVFDHLSIRWSSDYSFTSTSDLFSKTGTPSVRDVTAQRLLVAEPLKVHPVGMMHTSNHEWEDRRDTTHISYHHNLHASVDHRNPNGDTGGFDPAIAGYTGAGAPNLAGRTQYGQFIFQNNVVYNWFAHASQAAKFSVQNYIRNLYKRGPGTPAAGTRESSEFSEQCQDYSALGGDPNCRGPICATGGAYSGGTFLWAWGNIGPNNQTPDINNYPIRAMFNCMSAGSQPQYSGIDPRCEYGTWRQPETGRCGLTGLSGEGPPPVVPITRHTIDETYQTIVTDGDVGATKKLDCDGTWIPNVNSQDQRILAEARSGDRNVGTLGIRCAPGNVNEAGVCGGAAPGGYPTLATGPACAMTATDGIPDAFKARYTGPCPGPTCLAAGTNYHNVIGADGYTILEHYLNGTAPWTSSGGGGGGTTTTPPIVEYKLDEAASGSSPTALLDAQPVPLNVPITYASGQPVYVEEATGRGWDFATRLGPGGGQVAIDGTKIKTVLDGAQKLTLRAVFDIRDATNASTATLPWNLAIGPNGNTGFSVIFNGVAVNWTGFDWPNAGRTIVHVLIDTTQAAMGNRIRLRVDNVDQGPWDTGTQPAQNATLNLGTGKKLSIGNLDVALTHQGAIDGRIYGIAIYPAVLTLAELATDMAAINADDDADAVVHGETPPTSINYVGAGVPQATTTATTLTPGLVATSAGTQDEVVAFVVSRVLGGVEPVVTASGWSLVAKAMSSGANPLSCQVFNAAVSPTQAPAFSISTPGLGWYVRLFSWRNSPGPVAGIGSSATAALQAVPGTVTTLSANERVLSFAATPDLNDLDLSTPGAFTPRIIGVETRVPAIGISAGLADADQGTPATVVMPVWQQDANGPEEWCFVTAALDLIQTTPEPPSDPGPPGPIERFTVTERTLGGSRETGGTRSLGARP